MSACLAEAAGEAPLRLRVAARRQETAQICSLVLCHDEGRALPPFEAGAHIELHLPDGLRRAYSLCNSPRERDRYEIAVRLAPDSRGGSRQVHALLHEGVVVRAGAPRNHFALAAPSLAGAHSLLLGGGIGITPLLAMADTLSRQGASFELHCAARSAAQAAFGLRLAAAPYARQVRWHFDDGPAAQRLDLPALLGQAPEGSQLYLCGPPGLIDAGLEAARAAGWAGQRLHFERFGGPLPEAVALAAGAFELWLARSGRRVRVPPGQSAAEALAQAGVVVPVSCGQGVCGSCRTRVLAGEPEHLDMYLTPEEQAAHDCFMPCCSRARTPQLTLDL